MPKRSPILVPGEFYHVFNRGALKMPLFLDDTLYDMFIDLIMANTEKNKISMAAICLMPNHFHFLSKIEEDGDLPHFMQSVCGTLSRRLNTLYNRTGTVLEGRYHAKHVRDDAYFKQVVRYIHLNPVRAELVQHPSEWKFSSFADCIGFRKKINIAHELVTEHFGGMHQYADFVISDIMDRSMQSKHFINDLKEMKLV